MSRIRHGKARPHSPQRETEGRPHPVGWPTARRASSLLTAAHTLTGRGGRPPLRSRGQRLRRRPVGGASIRGCSRARRLLHGEPRGQGARDTLQSRQPRTCDRAKRKSRNWSRPNDAGAARADSVQPGETCHTRGLSGPLPGSVPGSDSRAWAEWAWREVSEAIFCKITSSYRVTKIKVLCAAYNTNGDEGSVCETTL